jgi:hypothetical protein
MARGCGNVGRNPVNWRRARVGEEVLEGLRSVGTRFEVRGGEGLTKFGLSVAARFGRRGIPVTESSGGCGGRLEVRGGAWRQWEAHRCQGGPGRWLVEAVIDEVAVEEVASGVSFGTLRRCSRGSGSGRGRVGMALRRTRALLDTVRRR